LLILPYAAQQQSAAAHVAATDELLGNPQSAAENRYQDIQIFSSGKASQENQLAVRANLAGEFAGGASK
jgi:hypothetical protein